MRKLFLWSALFVILGSVSTIVQAQTDIGIKPNFAGGEVVSLTDSKINLQTKDGVIEVVLSNATQYKRVSPENPSLKTAVESKFSEIGIGDKLLVTGAVAEDKKTIPAKAVYLMTKSDIAQKQIKEGEEWKTRGISGKVISVNPSLKEIIVSTKSLAGETKTTLTPKENASFYRYAPDSIKFSEAKSSNLGEISSGDTVRALGDKGENNTFQAEEIITGAFQTTAGTVAAIDAEKNEITITDIQTKKPTTILIGEKSILKQFPPEMAQRFATIQATRANGGQNSQDAPGNRPPGNNGGQDARPDAERRGGGSIDEMLERFPNITLADLKVGDMIAVSSSKSTNADKIVAIKLLSGVEPFLKAPQVSVGRGGRAGGQGGGQNSGFSIPGLDDGGVGNP